MNNVTLMLIVSAVIVLALIVAFRHKVSVSLEALGIRLKAKGQATPKTQSDQQAKESQQAEQGNVVVTSGDRSVSVGGNARDATIITGDKNRTGA